MLVSTVFSTGLSTFGNPNSIGPMYPGVGFEWVLVIVLFAAWVTWHIIQLRNEDRALKHEAEHFRKIGLEKVMKRGREQDSGQ
jgi:hypothetical protein